MARVLQRYADRGVFRALTVEPAAAGSTRFRFIWLTRRPILLRADRAGTRFVSVDLLPHVDGRSPLGTDIATLIAGRTARALPAHKRLDARRASVAATIRRGMWSLAVSARPSHAGYAVRYALNLVNDIFLLLQERYPEYLVDEFGLSSE